MSKFVEVIIHTGQHHDENMSRVFFDDLGIPVPNYNLGIAGGPHGQMTGRMIEALESVFVVENPDWVLVFGDTNSTLAATLAAAKLHIKVAHIEAGLRSFNMKMPEEINRIVADRLSALLLCPTIKSVENLSKEGIGNGVHLVGDVMYDVALHYADRAREKIGILSNLGAIPKNYVLATCHRAENTDCRESLLNIGMGLAEISKSRLVIMPMHPRTKLKIKEFGLASTFSSICTIDPLPYLEMAALESNAEIIVTDSGGVQKEAFFYRVPCVTIREETEWIETVDAGWNILVGSDASNLIDAVDGYAHRKMSNIDPYGNGDATERILKIVASLN